MKTIALAAALALFAAPAFAAGAIPDGWYDCNMDGYGNGVIAIAGNTYSGPDYSGDNSGTYTFAVSEGGNIDFHGPVGMYSDPSMQFIGGLVVYPDGQTPAIELHVKLNGGDTVHVSLCEIESH